MFKATKRSSVGIILLLCITVGIYGFYWMYKIAKELKYYLEDEKINPSLDLFLNIIFFPYIIYWFYKYGKLVAEAQQKAGTVPRENSVLYAILSIFGLFFISMVMMQSDLNNVWEHIELDSLNTGGISL